MFGPEGSGDRAAPADPARRLAPSQPGLRARLPAGGAFALGRRLASKTTGGGADANVFFQKGIITAVIGTGMRDIHTVRESIRLEDMARTGELLLEIIALHAKGGQDQ